LILDELSKLHPIWEYRYSKHNPPPPGQTQRRLLRPVYWLGNWQFACLNYYHPPKGIDFRCVEAEPFPSEMQCMVDEITEIVHNSFDPRDVPRGWELNTCLINYYGTYLHDETALQVSTGIQDRTGLKDNAGIQPSKRIDVARVGEHKDFEPGPVASISFGDRALFQFVDSPHKQAQSRVVLQQWLEDSSLQIFAGDRFKKKLFHRVQRVERKRGEIFQLNTSSFETRRLNFTFRFVPREHIQPLHRFPRHLREDVQPYVSELATKSDFWREAQRHHLPD
jgi:hypothetical protein